MIFFILLFIERAPLARTVCLPSAVKIVTSLSFSPKFCDFITSPSTVLSILSPSFLKSKPSPAGEGGPCFARWMRCYNVKKLLIRLLAHTVKNKEIYLLADTFSHRRRLLLFKIASSRTVEDACPYYIVQIKIHNSQNSYLPFGMMY